MRRIKKEREIQFKFLLLNDRLFNIQFFQTGKQYYFLIYGNIEDFLFKTRIRNYLFFTV
jgi:hypothetical protein